MFVVMFELQPRDDKWAAYVDEVKLLEPDLARVDGFVDNIRYVSLMREGWLLSLSRWRDERALVRWRTQPRHHAAQEHGRTQVLADYRLRVAQIIEDSQALGEVVLQEQRSDETQTGEGTCVVLTDARLSDTHLSDDLPSEGAAAAVARRLGLDPDAADMVSWDVYDAVLDPGNLILQTTWRTERAAEAFARSADVTEQARLRRARVIRDYTLLDRREAPQYFAPVG